MLVLKENKHLQTFKAAKSVKREKFAVIVPFRDNAYQDRSGHLAYFLPFMSEYLSKLADRDFVIIVVEQSQDGRKFNRGKLLNVGFQEALKMGCGYCIFHDVDLIPDGELLELYGTYPKSPMHLAANWDKYSHLDSFFGGVCSFNVYDFIKVNGFPNNFWGWGAEDDELLLRVKEKGLYIEKPERGRYSELSHIHAKEVASLVNPNRYELLSQREAWAGKNGLSDLKTTQIKAIRQAKHNVFSYGVEL